MKTVTSSDIEIESRTEAKSRVETGVEIERGTEIEIKNCTGTRMKAEKRLELAAKSINIEDEEKHFMSTLAKLRAES
ncbi:hypothetical protein EVAR_54264_1 [Eumeta japonica]|uniref:Uncharacterized protein n=1 Tax=Eumeta variegata TaxID=151549 RepID=A0A4C1YEX2_EUMVA|nr:hypothetical protein EVAR_54264_1 [Eumeta japonica]